MNMTDEAQQRLAQEVIAIWTAIRDEPRWRSGDNTMRLGDVEDRVSGLLFAIRQIGMTLYLAGGIPLYSKIIAIVEDALDDVEAAVFLNRWWGEVRHELEGEAIRASRLRQ
ncbi:hypothetical protein WBP07_12990 [Novosphingobium sp. BL-8A]|uniref:hypothetical protein n=1 Tax=Novosphingobium sp. BL-8A TaxID=3127639 RepID=UPI0037576F4C